jgi:plastocyanin
VENKNSNSSIITILSVVIFIALMTFFLFSGRNDDTAEESNTNQENTTESSELNTQTGTLPINTTIQITGMEYPSEIKIKAGESITWENLDGITHTVTFNSLSINESLTDKEKFTQVFETKGEYTYVCTLHPNMKGKIIVE